MAPAEVFLGGFEKAKEELVLIDNLVIAANGASFFAAEYGQFIMKALGPLFNSVSVVHGHEVSSQNLHLKKFAGYLTLSQSGASDWLVEGVKKAASLGLSCINVVNVEDSPITKVINELA